VEKQNNTELQNTINHTFLSTSSLSDKTEGYQKITNILKNEIEQVHLEYIAIKGPLSKKIPANNKFYYTLLSLSGKAALITGDNNYKIEGNYIARSPFNTEYKLEVEKGELFYCLLIRTKLEQDDLDEIAKEPDIHKKPYIKAIADCPVYKEAIKSPKTLNRMILPEGFVPRFCMGTVETTGPDEVGAHEHPMLEQLFLGLQDCSCTVCADDASILLTENMIMHVPLGSVHSVKVDKGDKLSYVWLDFFKTLEGQSYMDEQHEMEDN